MMQCEDDLLNHRIRIFGKRSLIVVKRYFGMKIETPLAE